MDISRIEFDESVWEIEGLTDYWPRQTPKWLRDLLLKSRWSHVHSGMSNDELLETVAKFDRPWLENYGRATIDGEEVFLLETERLFDAIILAWRLKIQVAFVEDSEYYIQGPIMYLRDRVWHSRKTAATSEVPLDLSPLDECTLIATPTAAR